MSQFIVTTGNPNEGFQYHGSFKTHEDATDWGLHYYSHSGFFVSELQPLGKTYTITKEQFSAIEMGLQLGKYFVQDQEVTGEMNESDSKTIKEALEAFKQLSNQEVIA